MVGAFVSASFWVMRFALSQQRAITDRFIAHLEKMLDEQKKENRLHREALRKLTGAVRRCSSLVSTSYRTCRTGPTEMEAVDGA